MKKGTRLNPTKALIINSAITIPVANCNLRILFTLLKKNAIKMIVQITKASIFCEVSTNCRFLRVDNTRIEPKPKMDTKNSFKRNSSFHCMRLSEANTSIKLLATHEFLK